MTEPLHVLFVCTANICRSPFMELLARELADGGLEVSSAGTHGLPDHPMDPAMTVGLTRRGVAHDSFRSRPLTADLVDTADLVLTAEVAHRRLILDQQPGAFRKVFTLGQFASAVPDADGTTGRGLVELVGTRQPPASASLDVDDPYRRGPERATACGDRIETLLRVVVPALTTSGRISA